jgi:hypothetical protein
MAGLEKIHWWRWLPLPWKTWKVLLRVEEADDVPDRLPVCGAVIIGEPSHPKWLAFDCPCNQGHRVMLNLDGRRRPAWRVDRLRPLTIAPSIDDVTTVRRCHFFIRDGRIRWAKPNDERRYQ